LPPKICVKPGKEMTEQNIRKKNLLTMGKKTEKLSKKHIFPERPVSKFM